MTRKVNAESVVAGTAIVLAAIVLVAILSILGAYPTKWVVNYLFSPTALLAVFGVAKFGFYKAFVLNIFSAFLIKTTGIFKS